MSFMCFKCFFSVLDDAQFEIDIWREDDKYGSDPQNCYFIYCERIKEGE